MMIKREEEDDDGEKRETFLGFFSLSFPPTKQHNKVERDRKKKK